MRSSFTGTACGRAHVLVGSQAHHKSCWVSSLQLPCIPHSRSQRGLSNYRCLLPNAWICFACTWFIASAILSMSFLLAVFIFEMHNEAHHPRCIDTYNHMFTAHVCMSQDILPTSCGLCDSQVRIQNTTGHSEGCACCVLFLNRYTSKCSTRIDCRCMWFDNKFCFAYQLRAWRLLTFKNFFVKWNHVTSLHHFKGESCTCGWSLPHELERNCHVWHLR